MQLILQNDDYKICEEFDGDGNRYFLCIPNSDVLEYQICCSLNENYLSPGDMLLKTSNIYSSLLKKNKKYIYAHMILDIGELTEAAHDNDNPLYTILLNKISATIKDAYQIIVKEKVAGISKQIGMISLNEDDSKFFDWLEINQVLPIERIKLGNAINRQVDEFEPVVPIGNSNGSNSLSGGSIELDHDKPLVKVRKPMVNNQGFSNMVLLIITFVITFAVCFGALYILIKK